MDLRATLGGKEMYPVRSVQSRGLANEVVANCIIEDLCVCVCVCVCMRERVVAAVVNFQKEFLVQAYDNITNIKLGLQCTT